MAIKKYVDLSSLTKFLDNLKNLFATKIEMNTKSDKTHTHNISDINNLQSTLDGKANSSHGTHVSYSTTTPVMDGTASVGSANTVARSDHRHPTDTSRASQTSLDSHTGNTTSHITSTERANWNTAYSHSQTAHAPSNAEPNQNAFSNVKIGDVTIAADIKTDTLTLVAGNNITLTPDSTNDKITISSKDTNTTYSAGTGISLSGTTFSNSGVRSIATGSSNGTISVNTNGTTENISVKGLGSAAYMASTAYDAAGAANSALATAKTYADNAANAVKNDLLNGAGGAYDTLKELGDLINDNTDAIDALETVAAGKANKTHTHAISDITNLQSTLNSKADSGHTHNNIVSRGNIEAETETTRPSISGISMTQAYNNGYATTYGNILNLKGQGDGQLLIGWSGTSGAHAPVYVRSKRDVSEANWSDWAQIYTTAHKPTPSDIGAASSSHTHKVANISDLTASATELNYVKGVTSGIQTQLDGKALSGHTHSYAGSSSVGGAATSANKLNTDAGSATQPVYFANGIPVKTTYTLGKSVPSNAVFTDTHYTSKNVVGATSATSNTTTALTNGNVYLNSVENGAVTSSHKISGSGATTVTTDTSGNIVVNSTNTTYGAAGSSLGLVKSGGDVTISSGVITVNDDSHNHTISNIDNLQTSLDAKQGTITGGASTITSSNLTTNRALISNGSGKVAVSEVTSTELGYLDGATSNVQAQLDGKSSTNHNHGLLHSNFTKQLDNTTTDSGWSMINDTYSGFILKSIRTQQNAPNWTQGNYSAGVAFGGADTKGIITHAYNSPSITFAGGNGDKPVWWIKATGTSGTTYNLNNMPLATKATQDGNGNNIVNTYATKTALDTKQATITGAATTITGSNLTANRALISNGSGKVAVSAVTSTELGYLDGVTSNIQTQLDGKAATSHTHNYAGSSSAGGSATSAVKLQTARSIGLGNDLTGSANFDGSGNITISAKHYNVSVNSGNKSNYPYHRFAYKGSKSAPITGQYNDTDAIFCIRETYNGGGYGVLKVSLRTNASTSTSQASATWLARYSFALDDVKIGLYNVAGATYADLYIKVGTYARTTVIQLEGNRSWTLVASSEVNDTTTSDSLTSTECYASIETAATKLHSQAYSSIISSVDGGNVNYANSAGSAISATTASSCSGNSATATKLSSAKTISLTGDVTGSTSFDGSGNVSITATVADDSHNHIISNVDGLQSALDGKSATSHNHDSAYIKKSLQFTADNGAQKLSYYKDGGKNILTEIAALTTGFYTMYSQSGTAGNPKTTEAWRFMIHKTGNTTGWVQGYGSLGSVYTNYQDGDSGWRGWRCIWDNDPNPLWSGAMYMSSSDGTPQTVTPSKKLSECRTGWLLLWSDYDPGGGANDADFATTIIPKNNPSGGTWGGKSFLCDIPRYVGSNTEDVDTERRIMKPIYVHDNRIEGSYQNAYDERNDVVLRAVYEI